MKKIKSLLTIALATTAILGTVADSAAARGSGGIASGSLFGSTSFDLDYNFEIFELQKDGKTPQTLEMAIENFTLKIYRFDDADNQGINIPLSIKSNQKNSQGLKPKFIPDSQENLNKPRLEYTFDGQVLKDNNINDFTLIIDDFDDSFSIPNDLSKINNFDSVRATTDISYIIKNNLFSFVNGFRLRGTSKEGVENRVVFLEQEGVGKANFQKVTTPESSNLISLLTLGLIGTGYLIKHRI